MLSAADPAATASPLTPVLALVGVALTAIITFITTWHWPTLRRRVQDHVALLKDLPQDMGEELRDLVEDELDLLAKRERKRLSPLGAALLYAARALVTLYVFSILTEVTISLVAPHTVSQAVDHVFWPTGLILWCVAWFVVLAGRWLNQHGQSIWAKIFHLGGPI